MTTMICILNIAYIVPHLTAEYKAGILQNDCLNYLLGMNKGT